MSPRPLLAVALGGAAAILVLPRLVHDRLGGARASMRRSSMPGVSSYALLTFVFGPVYDRIARRVAAEAPPGAAVLDVGTGPGPLPLRLARLAPGLRITGLDIDPAMIERATRDAARAFAIDDPSRPRFVTGDAAALPFPDAAFDLVVTSFSMHHWPDPQAGMAEMVRVLRPGGKVVIWDIATPHDAPVTGPRAGHPTIALPFQALRFGLSLALGLRPLADPHVQVKPAAAD